MQEFVDMLIVYCIEGRKWLLLISLQKIERIEVIDNYISRVIFSFFRFRHQISIAKWCKENSRKKKRTTNDRLQPIQYEMLKHLHDVTNHLTCEICTHNIIDLSLGQRRIFWWQTTTAKFAIRLSMFDSNIRPINERSFASICGGFFSIRIFMCNIERRGLIDRIVWMNLLRILTARNGKN